MSAHVNETLHAVLSNAEIADRLASLAQLLSSQKENPWKIKAYQRAAARVRNLAESVEELVHDDADLTRYAGIGEAIASAIREIVLTGSLGKLDKLRAQASPELLISVRTLVSIPNASCASTRSSAFPRSKSCAKGWRAASWKNFLGCEWRSTSATDSPRRLRCSYTEPMICAALSRSFWLARAQCVGPKLPGRTGAASR
jgi:hypothetical protein